jgi:hypothetical protein
MASLQRAGMGAESRYFSEPRTTSALPPSAGNRGYAEETRAGTSLTPICLSHSRAEYTVSEGT